jgi:hypothetical protein
MMKSQLTLFLICFLPFFTACTVTLQTDTDVTPLMMPTPVVVAETPTPELAKTEAVPTNGSDIADLLNNPPASGESVEIDAYFSGANPYLMPGGLWRSYEDRVNCPYYLNNLLTDEPFLPGLTVLHQGMSNMPAAESAWFLAATQETAQPGAYPEAELPYHARLRGHLGDAAFADCENRDRIFLVEEVTAVYAEAVPNPSLHAWEIPSDYIANWLRYEDESLGYSFIYPPEWQIETVSDPALASSLLVRYPERPSFPVMIRVHPGEAVLDRFGEALEPPMLAGMFMQPFVQGWGAGMSVTNNQQLPGFIGETEPKPDSRFMAVYFLGDGRTYEIALEFPMGFAASQTLLTDYSIIVESFRLDFLPDPTPTALPLPHDTPTPLPLGAPAPTPTNTPMPTATPVTAVPLTIQYFNLLQVEELNPSKRLTFDWATSGAGGVCLVGGTARRLGPWWQVPLTGTLTVEIASTLYRDPSFTLQAYKEGEYCAVPDAPPDAPNHVSQSVAIDWECDIDYFFTPAPQRCPLDTAVASAAAEQLFENGRMIWLENTGSIFVFYNDGQFQRFEDVWQPGDPESDPALLPPEDLYQPIRGFGNVWREQPAVRERLGWALAPEQGFSTLLQAEHHEGSSSGSRVYLRTADGQVIWHLGSLSGSWGSGLP